MNVNEVIANQNDSYPEQPIEQTPENYRELQAMVFYADPLFIGRNGAWLSSQAVLLAIAVAKFKQVPIPMVLTLAVSGVLVSVFWFFAAKSLADRIAWLDNELGKFEGSIHARYLYDPSNLSGVIPPDFECDGTISGLRRDTAKYGI